MEVVPYCVWNAAWIGSDRYDLEYVGLLFWWVRNKLKSEEGEKEVEYEMKGKLENTENTIKDWINGTFYLDIQYLSQKTII